MTHDHELDESAAGEGFADYRARLRAGHFRFEQEPEPDPEEGRWSDLRCSRYVRAWEAEQRRKGLL